MSIGILTFHFSTNYGAVLQAYALRTYLARSGHQAQVIDYIPQRFRLSWFQRYLSRRPSVLVRKWAATIREHRMQRFRREHLELTARYTSWEMLKTSPPACDVYVCGSDQVWNPYFTGQGEGGPTYSYFLDFGDRRGSRVAYAASFGTRDYPAELCESITPLLQRFDAISVREQSGLDRIKHMGFDRACLVPDPTLLLNAQDYAVLTRTSRGDASSAVMIYALHHHQATIRGINRYISDQGKTVRRCGNPSTSTMGITEWLNAMMNSEAVVTNSFHGTVFAVLFNRPFIAVAAEGGNRSMNDRLHTLLRQLDLEDRFVDKMSAADAVATLAQPIDWERVKARVDAMRDKGRHFLEEAIGRPLS